MFKLLSKVYTMLSYSGRYISSRPSIYTYTKTNQNVEPICCNAFRNLETKNINRNINIKSEESFMCEMTNKPKRKGNEDCKCEKTCILKKSETQLIHDSSNKMK
jgi:hypothetical protein